MRKATEVSGKLNSWACSSLSRVSMRQARASPILARYSVLNLREALQKYVELSPSTPPFLTVQFYEKDLTPTLNLLQISGRYSLRSGIFDTPSAWAYLFSPLKVIQVTGSVG